ncbi:MAG: Proline-tRNA ligase [candidate division CPR1 bacterium GW2011_GWA2_42_17]|uniref:Proline--tRNA ligase n=1 Tax=candidate division CPR1 bacterium GW2011_GWA2_42_17 TaxID=1618341 RepID=A0A0G0Z691_9BACT|nr:MAG: Proline-tRNA ligase [candidate division CPR1 bacterium GW2011_GWA2_42_17]
MRYSRLFPPTLRVMRANMIASHQLLEKAGFIRSVASSGIFALLPLGKLVHDRICGIVFDEMSQDGIQHVDLPILQSSSLWEQTGRWEKYLKSHTMFTTKEHYSSEMFGLSPTAEEVITTLVAADIKSWRQLPVIIHQIGRKFRDEMRPRYGMVRSREFVMSDAYSFDLDEEGMRNSFELMRAVYTRIFKRLGLKNCISVQADSGAIGGKGSAEFMAVCDVGEDTLLTCDKCDYGANMEKANSHYPKHDYSLIQNPMRRELTPNTRTVEELEKLFPGIKSHNMIKTIIFTVNPDSDQSYEVAVCIRGDLAINVVKLTNILGAEGVVAAVDSVVEEVTGAAVGFAGPIGLTSVKRILFDESTRGMINFLCGVNTTDNHGLDVNFGRDIDEPLERYELHVATSGHGCPDCGGELKESKGIEVGHVFMLQRGYAEAMNAKFLDDSGKLQTMWMGCYGIGTTRLVHAIVEQNHDAQGIIWPITVAPFLVHIVPIDYANQEQAKVADELYQLLSAKGVDVLLDDRPERAGVKFNDADLIGCPYRVNIGRLAGERKVEFRNRESGSSQTLDIEQVIELCVNFQQARTHNNTTSQLTLAKTT